MEIIRPFGKLPELKRTEFNDDFVPHVVLKGLFNETEISRILDLWDNEKSKEGKVGIDGQVELDIRKSKIFFIEPNDNSNWIYDKLAMACIMTNASKYKFDISGFQTRLQLTRYSEGEFYHWHTDSGKGKLSVRKLSITVQLTDETEYEGGELQFLTSKDILSAPKEKGTAIIFPSYTAHRVQPVTSGTRKSIVGWIAGPPFR